MHTEATLRVMLLTETGFSALAIAGWSNTKEEEREARRASLMGNQRWNLAGRSASS